ncbi:unnamed protein product [Larinioides sclopetarius]|uniref:Uncharacterized protein n=1 Tax=Larinioides sclopetarius TaxID=280406 RepID=A0AAV2AQF8_9ARAC
MFLAGCPTPLCADSSCRIGIPQGSWCPTCICENASNVPGCPTPVCEDSSCRIRMVPDRRCPICICASNL